MWLMQLHTIRKLEDKTSDPLAFDSRSRKTQSFGLSCFQLL
jgi:hypothetical protein